MSQEKEVYVHGEGGSQKLLKVVETILLKELHKEAKMPAVNEKVFFFVEDGETELEGELTIEHHKIPHRQHIHCHRCHKIKVSVTYNGQVHKEFAPGTTGRKILKWALKDLKVDGVGYKLVMVGTNIELMADDHVGSFVKYPECKIELNLTKAVVVQG